MVHHLEPQHGFYHILNLLNARVTELHHFTTILTYNVIMLTVFVRPFKVCDILAELMLGHQFAIKKYLNGIVERSAAYTVILVLHLNVKRLDIKVAIA
jgi:hypothetical protein